MSYYNTNKETGSTLARSENKARVQENAILSFFMDHRRGYFSNPEIRKEVFGNGVPITSISRALRNLTKLGFLKKTNNMVMGEFGKLIHTWKMKNGKR